MRRLLCILLMLCLPLQGFAMQWGAAIQTSEMSLLHEVLHEEQVSHHHESDGSIHYDHSDESSQHIQDHSSSPQPAGLIVALNSAPPLQLVSVLHSEFTQFVPDPLLDSPHKPPTFALG